MTNTKTVHYPPNIVKPALRSLSWSRWESKLEILTAWLHWLETPIQENPRCSMH